MAVLENRDSPIAGMCDRATCCSVVFLWILLAFASLAGAQSAKPAGICAMDGCNCTVKAHHWIFVKCVFSDNQVNGIYHFRFSFFLFPFSRELVVEVRSIFPNKIIDRRDTRMPISWNIVEACVKNSWFCENILKYNGIYIYISFIIRLDRIVLMCDHYNM